MREFAVFFRKCPKTFVQDCKSVDCGRSMLFSTSAFLYSPGAYEAT